MDPFAWFGNAWRRRAWAAALGVGLTIGLVYMLDQKRLPPDLTSLTQQRTHLLELRAQLAHLPPAQSVHQHILQLRTLAQTLPYIKDLKAISSSPEQAPEIFKSHLQQFGGEIGKVAVRGSLLSVIALCRTAQQLMPLAVDTLKVQNRLAHVTLYVLGAPNPDRGGDA